MQRVILKQMVNGQVLAQHFSTLLGHSGRFIPHASFTHSYIHTFSTPKCSLSNIHIHLYSDEHTQEQLGVQYLAKVQACKLETWAAGDQNTSLPISRPALPPEHPIRWATAAEDGQVPLLSAKNSSKPKKGFNPLSVRYN